MHGREFQLLMISAMYENGGNTTQRLLDGHPELFSYPFESQPGTRLVADHLSSLFPAKYRWPVFALDGRVEDDYEAIIDEECKVRIKTPQSSKFRDQPIELTDAARKAAFVACMAGKPRTRANLVEAFFRASAEAWRDARRSGEERMHVGYSPILVVDADKIVRDLPESRVLHIVRNPWSCYADTKKRAVPLSLAHYMTGWCINQQAALTFREMFPERVHLLRYEDIIVDPARILGDFVESLGLSRSETLRTPSWNGKPLDQVYPWGTIRTPTTEANRATANELTLSEKSEIAVRTRPLLAALNYEAFGDQIRRPA
ncbi:MAG TPA: sulfotransferase [Gemmataceae bacterium]|nr:sulfotransferase [Gemmataceae bacterium]